MQKIVPHLWFETEAVAAADFYVSTFGKNSSVLSTHTLYNTPSGDVDTVSFALWGYEFQAISAGPSFTPNPSISFMVNFDPSQHEDANENIDAMWEKITQGGKVLMPLDAYPFSTRYGWVEDKYGFSWQLIRTDPEGEDRPLIMPSLLFVQENYGKAEEATAFYISVFKNARRGIIARYPANTEPHTEGTVMFTDFTLEEQWFAAMDGALVHDYNFTEAISLIVRCESQDEIDYYFENLSASLENEQCGWLKDKYGVSWQIIPSALETLLRDPDPDRVSRVMESFLQMKKIDIAQLQSAANRV